MIYLVSHRSTYHYSEPASLSQNELMLTPRSTTRQQVLATQLSFEPEPQLLRSRSDYFGNIVYTFMAEQPHRELKLIANSTVQTGTMAPFSMVATSAWEDVAHQLFHHPSPELLEAFQFVFPSSMARYSPAVQDYVQPSFPPGRPVLEGAIDLMNGIFNEFTYDKSASTVDTEVEQILQTRKGVCQDFSHLAIACLRALGLAARYVSGYLETIPPPGKIKLVGSDASHAWISVFIPELGWVDFDPTNNVIPGERHITLAWGRDYSDVAPIRGVVMGGGAHTLSVQVDVIAQHVA